MIRDLTSDARVKIISQQNCGVSAARNRGVMEAKYDHIAFLDGDDVWLPTYLEQVVKNIEYMPDAGMYCMAGYVTDSSMVYLRIAEKYNGRTLIVDFFEAPDVFAHTSATVIKRELFQRVGGFMPGLKYRQDMVLFCSAGLSAKVVYCGIPLSVYMGDVLGQTTSASIVEKIKYVVWGFNITCNKWIETDKKNKRFKTYFKYTVRHQIISLIRTGEKIAFETFIQGLNEDSLRLFAIAERFLYGHWPLHRVAKYYILYTKLLWRFRRYPRVSEKHKKSLKYLNVPALAETLSD